MDDLISRQAVIDALLGITAMRNTIPLESAIFNIKKLPSAQPEVAKDINVPTNDYISRQAAIDNLERYRELFSWDDGDRERAILSRVIKELQSMPSEDTYKLYRRRFYKALGEAIDRGLLEGNKWLI